jgi:hypothetical protein
MDATRLRQRKRSAGAPAMRQKNIRVYRNPDRGQSVTVTWGDGGENEYGDATEAATALGCSPEWLEKNLDDAFLASIGVSELDLYWDDSATWRTDNVARTFSQGDRVNLFGEITDVDTDRGEVTVRILGVPTSVTLSNENVVLLERGVHRQG